MIFFLFGDAGGEGLGPRFKVQETELTCFLELKAHGFLIVKFICKYISYWERFYSNLKIYN